MNSILQMVTPRLPSSEYIKLSSAFGLGCSAATLYADSYSYWGWAAGIAGCALWAVKSVKEEQDNVQKKEREAAAFSSKFLNWVKKCISSKQTLSTMGFAVV